MSAGAALATVALVLLMAFYRHDRTAKKRERAQFFTRVLHMFRSYQVVQDDVAYPVLRGVYRGYDVRLDAIIDNMSWRKLPILYLNATIIAPTAYKGIVDFLSRPSGFEIFSQAHHLQHRLSLPQDWPQDALLATDDPAGLPPLDIIIPQVRSFADRQLKELVVTPHGVRLVRKIEECSRAHYTAFREIKFTQADLDPALVRATLDAAIALHDAVAPEATAKVA